MKAKSSASCGSFASFFVARSHFVRNALDRVSGTQIWTGRKPFFCNSARWFAFMVPVCCTGYFVTAGVPRSPEKRPVLSHKPLPPVTAACSRGIEDLLVCSFPLPLGGRCPPWGADDKRRSSAPRREVAPILFRLERRLPGRTQLLLNPAVGLAVEEVHNQSDRHPGEERLPRQRVQAVH